MRVNIVQSCRPLSWCYSALGARLSALAAISIVAAAPSVETTASLPRFEHARAVRHLDGLQSHDFPIRVTYRYFNDNAPQSVGRLVVELGMHGETRVTENFPWRRYEVTTVTTAASFRRDIANLASGARESIQSAEAESSGRAAALKYWLVLLHQTPDWAQSQVRQTVVNDEHGERVQIAYRTSHLEFSFDRQGLLRTAITHGTVKPIGTDGSFGEGMALVMKTEYGHYETFGRCLFAKDFAVSVIDGPAPLKSLKESGIVESIQYGGSGQ